MTKEELEEVLSEEDKELCKKNGYIKMTAIVKAKEREYRQRFYLNPEKKSSGEYQNDELYDTYVQYLQLMLEYADLLNYQTRIPVGVKSSSDVETKVTTTKEQNVPKNDINVLKNDINVPENSQSVPKNEEKVVAKKKDVPLFSEDDKSYCQPNIPENLISTLPEGAVDTFGKILPSIKSSAKDMINNTEKSIVLDKPISENFKDSLNSVKVNVTEDKIEVSGEYVIENNPLDNILNKSLEQKEEDNKKSLSYIDKLASDESVFNYLINNFKKNIHSLYDPLIKNFNIDMKKFNDKYKNIYFITGEIRAEKQQILNRYPQIVYNLTINKLDTQLNKYIDTLRSYVIENKLNDEQIKSYLNNMSLEYKKNSNERIVIDYIAGMTDDYTLKEYNKIIKNKYLHLQIFLL